MSEPITRAEMAAIIEAVRNTASPIVGNVGGPIPPNPFVEMADAMAAALSASPPRVPGASAHPGRVGVESGPGQPIDLAENFETRAQWHDKIGSTKAAADCRQAAAEIRRLRDRSDTRRIIEEAPANYYKQGYRAGIEAAAKMLEPLTSWSGPRGALATEVRALADKPPTDILLPGLEYAEAHVIAFDKPDQFIRWLRASIAARKGG